MARRVCGLSADENEAKAWSLAPVRTPVALRGTTVFENRSFGQCLVNRVAAAPFVDRCGANTAKSTTWATGEVLWRSGRTPIFAGTSRGYLLPPLSIEKTDVVHHSCVRRARTLPFSQQSNEVVEDVAMSEHRTRPPARAGSVNTRGGCSERRHCRACGGRGADVRRGNQRSAGEAGALGLPAPCRRLMSRLAPASCPAMANTGSSAGRAEDATHSQSGASAWA